MGYIKKSTKKAILALGAMQKLYGDYPLTELNYETPFQCLVAVMLSAQTTDRQVNVVSSTFFQVMKSPQDVIDLGEERVKGYIRTVGLWTAKLKNLMKTAQLLIDKTKEKKELLDEYTSSSEGATFHTRSRYTPPLENETPKVEELHDRNENNIQGNNTELFFNSGEEVLEQYGYYLPDTIEEMTELAGVGTKTAKVVLYILYRQRWVAVDTHVHRVMNRLGIVKTKSPDQSSKKLEEIIPDTRKDIAHHVVIYFGRYLCKAKKPECERCPLWEVCVWEGKKER